MGQKLIPTGKVLIVVDVHESGTDIEKLLASYGAQVILRSIEVGDYILSDRVAVERKTTEDFLNSIKDGRLFSQLIELSRNFDSPILVLEGNGLFLRSKMHPNAIRGAIASIVTDYKVPILTTTGLEETAAQIFWIAKREQEELKKSVSIRGEKKGETARQKQEYLLAGLPNVSKITAERLLNHFGSPLEVFNASENDLIEVEGVGKKTAKGIKSVLESECED
ncbi:MAG: hypothetical protein HY051_03860 [Candidatus Aenigmarchaeota archaeon]|nr:hypothetical protein [Candidatus Aenigmarchaeota archaeon]